MNKVRRLLLAVALASTFTLSASADEIECGVTATTPQPTQQATQADSTSIVAGVVITVTLSVVP